MDELLLSQSEIDALLASLASEGDADAQPTAAPAQPVQQAPATETVRRYDFRRPERFSKEQIRALRMIHENWARRASVSLSANLRSSVEITLAEVDQDVYSSLASHVHHQGLYCIVSLLPLPGHILLHASMDLSQVAVDRILGGPGILSGVQRGLTELELELLQSLFTKILIDFQEAWAMTIPTRPRIDDISINLMLIPIALPSDAVVWINFEVKIKGMTTGLVIGLPYSVLKPIGARLSPHAWLQNSEPGIGESEQLHREEVAKAISRVKVPVSALLGSAQLSVEELAALQAGDIILLGPATDTTCSVLVNGHLKFLARPGTRYPKNAIEIVQVVGHSE